MHNPRGCLIKHRQMINARTRRLQFFCYEYTCSYSDDWLKTIQLATNTQRMSWAFPHPRSATRWPQPSVNNYSYLPIMSIRSASQTNCPSTYAFPSSFAMPNFFCSFVRVTRRSSVSPGTTGFRQRTLSTPAKKKFSLLPPTSGERRTIPPTWASACRDKSRWLPASGKAVFPRTL